MQHPDEGTIHAWLDGALPAEEARALEAHVAGCAACAAAVSEARGLLAASSRILSALDSVPGGVLPATPADIGDTSARTVRRSSPWRSPGWRAAAAIVVVGAVSWLATRSGGPASVATEYRMSTAPAAAARPGMRNDTLPAAVVAEAPREPAPMATEAPRRVGVPRPQPGLMRVQRNVAPREASSGVAAPPGATADAAAPMRDSVVAGAMAGAAKGEASGALREAMANRAAAGASARMGVGQRLAPPSPSAVMAEAMPPMAKAIAPTRASDDAQRLAGCYALSAAWTVSTEHGRAATALLPARVELTRDRDSSANPGTFLLRPAPGERAFAAGTLGEWKSLGGSTVELQIRDDAAGRVSAILAVAGDSVSGEARSYAGESAAPLVTAVKGQRIACPPR